MANAKRKQKMRREKKPSALDEAAKPCGGPWGKFAQRVAAAAGASRQAGRQLVGCLNERSNEHRNECAPHDKYVKFLLKLSSICCQFLTTSATNFVLVLVLVLVLGVSQTQLNSTSFSYFFSASFLAQ